MLEYWGLRAIASRLGYRNYQSVLRDYENHGLPMLKRRHGRHPRLLWYTCEPLILAYQVASVQLQRKDMLEQKKKHRQQETSVNRVRR